MLDFAIYLRNCKTRNRKARNNIRFQKLQAIIRRPLKNGEEKLEPQNQLPEPRLVLKPMKRIVGEEDLREAVPEFLHGGPTRRKAHSVHLQRRRRRRRNSHCIRSSGFQARSWGKMLNSVRVYTHTFQFLWSFISQFLRRRRLPAPVRR